MTRQKIAIVTDSTADIPQALAQELGIVVVPLNVIFGERSYKDGVDIGSKEFFEMLPQATVHPRTSQPSPGEFVDVYNKVLEESAEIISIHISSGMSGTYQSAVLAAEMVGKGRVTLIDSLNTSLGLGLAVILAARARNEGASRPEIVEKAKAVCDKLAYFISVESLVWLERNGRIGKASALLGALLNVHPILRLKDGGIVAHTKVRGKMSKVLTSLVESAGEFVPHGSRVRVAIMHGNCPERAADLKKLVEAAYKVEETITNQIGPVVGVHVGPGAIGLVVVPY
ncbi:MAG: DegV family protein [Thermaerobacter sp.]|nr:DegV family protein [Thermaerobacter sp.]